MKDAQEWLGKAQAIEASSEEVLQLAVRVQQAGGTATLTFEAAAALADQAMRRGEAKRALGILVPLAEASLDREDVLSRVVHVAEAAGDQAAVIHWRSALVDLHRKQNRIGDAAEGLRALLKLVPDSPEFRNAPRAAGPVARARRGTQRFARTPRDPAAADGDERPARAARRRAAPVRPAPPADETPRPDPPVSEPPSLETSAPLVVPPLEVSGSRRAPAAPVPPIPPPPSFSAAPAAPAAPEVHGRVRVRARGRRPRPRSGLDGPRPRRRAPPLAARHLRVRPLGVREASHAGRGARARPRRARAAPGGGSPLSTAPNFGLGAAHPDASGFDWAASQPLPEASPAGLPAATEAEPAVERGGGNRARGRGRDRGGDRARARGRGPSCRGRRGSGQPSLRHRGRALSARRRSSASTASTTRRSSTSDPS